MKNKTLLTLSFLTSLAVSPNLQANPMAHAADLSQNLNSCKQAEITLRQNMRKLWSDHVFWTRDYIVAVMNG